MGRGVGDGSMRNLNGTSTSTDEGVMAFGTLPATFMGGNVAMKGAGNIKVPVYRAYGGGSSMYDKSYSLFNPKYVPFYRNFAELPNVNSGEYLLKGSLRLKNVNIGRWFATPLDGNVGGLPFELYQNYNQLINPNYKTLNKTFKMFDFFKNRKQSLSDDDQDIYLKILNNIYLILLRTNPPQSEVLKKLTDLITRKDFVKFNEYLNGKDMWGGSGAVWEVHIENKNEENEFEKEMILLINLMEKTNYLGKGIKPIKKIFEDNVKP